MKTDTTTWIDFGATNRNRSEAAERFRALRDCLDRLPNDWLVTANRDDRVEFEVLALQRDPGDEAEQPATIANVVLLRADGDLAGPLVDIYPATWTPHRWRFVLDSFADALGVLRAIKVNVGLPASARIIETPPGVQTLEEAQAMAAGANIDPEGLAWTLNGWLWSLDATLAIIARQHGDTVENVVESIKRCAAQDPSPEASAMVEAIEEMQAQAA